MTPLLAIDPDVLVPILMFILVGVIIVLFIYFEDRRRFLREMKKTPRTSISRATNGEYSKIVGVAKNVQEPMKAPLSNRSCIFYHVKVEQKRDKNGWSTIIDDMSNADFFIESGDEMAIVKMDQPYTFRKIILQKDHIKNSGFLNDANEKLEAYLRRHNKKSTYAIGLNKSLRYSEGIIELDETVAVKGVAKWKGLKDMIPGYNYSKILTLEGSKDQKLLISDLKEAIQG